MRKQNKVLLFGIGNSGREDDGLGWAFLDEIQSVLPDSYDFEYRYQLQVEDAALLSTYDMVIFVDAHHETFKNGYIYKDCQVRDDQSFTSHELTPETVLFLAYSLYNKLPKAKILGISAINFNLNIGLSSVARTNLSKTLLFFKNEVLGLRINSKS